MGEIVFVRHGQATFGTDDYDRLSPLGWQQARWLGEHLASDGWRFDRAIMGDMRRHRETASAIADGLVLPDFDVVPGLNEMDFDLLQTDAVSAGVADPGRLAEPGGFAGEFAKILTAWSSESFQTMHEPFDLFRARVCDAVDQVAAEGQSVLIVSSGGPKAVIMRHVLGFGIETMAQIGLDVINSSISRFNVRDGGLSLTEFNATPHLAGPDRVHARTYI
ncbi:MAG: histidine phosphatase family protein [Pseudomonadota bacterium]